ncbi:MAG: hypothetical protein U9P79_02780 [Candidatus Cloacimonadota bacterium]|nr:hypothetical protein [Candidatus Cloacimonadota bacterium]
MKKALSILLILLTILSLLACKEKREDKIVAEVRDIKLYEKEFQSLFSEEEWNNLSEENKTETINDWVEISLLAEEAKKQGLDKLPDVKFNIKYSAKTILANKLLSNELKKINISEGEIFDYYNLNRADFMTEITTFKIQSFIVENWTVADSVISLFNGGEAFYTAAKNLGSNYKVKFIQKKDVSTYFWNYIQSMKQWNMRVIQDGKNLKVVQLLKIQKEDVPINFISLKDSLHSKLIEDKRENFLENSLDSLKINYNVTIY